MVTSNQAQVKCERRLRTGTLRCVRKSTLARLLGEVGAISSSRSGSAGCEVGRIRLESVEIDAGFVVSLAILYARTVTQTYNFPSLVPVLVLGSVP